jgi:DNA topoisomerase-1
LGRFGPYIVHDGDFRSIPKTDNLFTIGLERALELLNKPKAGRGRAAPVKELGKIDGVDEPVAVYSGKYGPYIKCGKTNVSLPEGMKPEDVTLEIALKLVSAKTGEDPSKSGEGGKAKSGKAPKKTGKKTAKKVAAAEKDDGDEADAPAPKAAKAVVVKKAADKASEKKPRADR